MKKLICGFIVFGSVTTFAVDCERWNGNTAYPVSKEAIEISVATKLKTCTRSKRFADAFKAKFNRDLVIGDSKK